MVDQEPVTPLMLTLAVRVVDAEAAEVIRTCSEAPEDTDALVVQAPLFTDNCGEPSPLTCAVRDPEKPPTVTGADVTSVLAVTFD